MKIPQIGRLPCGLKLYPLEQSSAQLPQFHGSLAVLVHAQPGKFDAVNVHIGIDSGNSIMQMCASAWGCMAVYLSYALL